MITLSNEEKSLGQIAFEAFNTTHQNWHELPIHEKSAFQREGEAVAQYTIATNPLVKELVEALTHSAWLVHELKNPSIGGELSLEKRVDLAQLQVDRYHKVLDFYYNRDQEGTL